MNYRNGKKLTIVGFGLNLLFNIVNILIFLEWFKSTDAISAMLNYGYYISMGVVALGFLLMWLTYKEMIDLLSCGATGIVVFLGLLNYLGIINTGSQLGGMIISVILSAFYLVLALRAKKFNILISLLLVCAFIYQVIPTSFFINILRAKMDFSFFQSFLVLFIGDAICVGICVVEVKKEVRW